MRSAMKLVIFTVTFVSYGFYHASRKTLSGVKSSLKEEWTHNGSFSRPFISTDQQAETFLGGLDSVFMAAYALSMFFWGWLGDRVNPRNVLVFGMVSSAIALVAFGAFPKWFHFYSIPYYLFVYILFGALQATGWPNEIAIMGNWFNEDNRGLILGLWASCQSLGNILGSLLIAFILPYGYEYTFVLNSCLMVVGAVLVALCVKRSPLEVSYGYAAINAEAQPSSVDSSSSSPFSGQNPLRFFDALLLPSVIPYCLCNACVKFVNYAFFFWLPLYLTTAYSWTETNANALSIWFDIGGIIGSIVGGVVSDQLGCRSPVIVVMLVISLFALLLYAHTGGLALVNVLVMTVVGFTISGPYNLIVGTISVDLGSQPILSSNAQAMGTVSGLIDGTGSAGSAIGQIIIPIVEANLGWHSVFYMFILMNGLAVLCLLRRFSLDIKALFRPSHRIESEPLLSTQSL